MFAHHFVRYTMATYDEDVSGLDPKSSGSTERSRSQSVGTISSLGRCLFVSALSAFITK